MLKRTTVALLFISVAVVAFGQPRTRTEVIKLPRIYSSYYDIEASLTYKYNVDDEGGHIWHGPVSLSTDKKWVYDGDDYSYYYSLATAFKNGKIDGDLSIEAKYTNSWDDSKTVENYLTGCFKEGRPEGSFIFSISKGNNYDGGFFSLRDSMLVGNYAMDGVIGCFDSMGLKTGSWHLANGNDEEYLSGVLVRLTTSGMDTPPRQERLARDYAKGVLSAAELLDEGFLIEITKEEFGKKIWELVSSDSFGGWTSALGVEDFSNRYPVVSKKLVTPSYITEEELEKLMADFPRNTETYEVYPVDDVPLRRIRFNISPSYYGSYYSSEYITRYVPKDQVARVDSLLSCAAIRNNTLTLEKYLNTKNNLSSTDYKIIHSAKSLFLDSANYDSILRYYEIYKKIKGLIDNNPELDFNSVYETPLGPMYCAGGKYITVESVKQYQAAVEHIESYMPGRIEEENRIEEEKARLRAEERARLEAEKKEVRRSLDSALSFLVRESKLNRIVGSPVLAWYFNCDTYTTAYWKEKLSPICPVLSCSVTSFSVNDSMSGMAKVIVKSKYLFTEYEYMVKFVITKGLITDVFIVQE